MEAALSFLAARDAATIDDLVKIDAREGMCRLLLAYSTMRLCAYVWPINRPAYSMTENICLLTCLYLVIDHLLLTAELTAQKAEIQNHRVWFWSEVSPRCVFDLPKLHVDIGMIIRDGLSP